MHLDPINSEYRSEAARQLMAAGDVELAMNMYSESSQLDESNLDALCGMIRCKIAKQNYNDSAQELDFLTDVRQADEDNKLTLLHLQAVLASRTNR